MAKNCVKIRVRYYNFYEILRIFLEITSKIEKNHHCTLLVFLKYYIKIILICKLSQKNYLNFDGVQRDQQGAEQGAR